MKEIKDFYPTPEELINKMVAKIDIEKLGKNDLNILEPSAGKGDIIERILNNLDYNKYNFHKRYFVSSLDCIEIDNNLRAILKDKKFDLIDTDFLKFETHKEYDVIIMNPPFDNGVHHLLKAISLIERNGGQIICLLNSETLKNPYSNFRKDLLNKLEEYGAEVEYLENAFSNAERETDVEVALINIIIPKVLKSDLFENLRESKNINVEDLKATKVTSREFLQNLIERYNFEIEYGIKLIKEVEYFNKFIDKRENQVELTSSYYHGGKIKVNPYIEKLRYQYWKMLFENENLENLFTSELRSKFYQNIENMRKFEFNIENIKEVLQMLSNNMKSSLEEDILNLFDEFSHKYHYYDETSKNIHYYNGWKTNKAHMINNKVIIPLNTYNDWRKEFDISYSGSNKIMDIYKIFMYLDNENMEKIPLKDIEERLRSVNKDQLTKNIDLEYFKISLYKKGTVHIVFKNEKLLLKFNIFGGQMKKWLPPSYGKKKYEDLDTEEREVIDSFQGKNSYEEVVKNSNLYLFKKEDIQLIGIK